MVEITPVGLEMIKMFESLRLNAYKDSVGVWTIGYGHTLKVKEGDVITQEQADNFLYDDLVWAQDSVRAALSYRDISNMPYAFDALVSFVFNLGPEALGKSTLLKRVLNYEDRDAAAEFQRWTYAGGKSLFGLRRRRFAEAVRFLGGDLAMVSMAYNGVK